MRRLEISRRLLDRRKIMEGLRLLYQDRRIFLIAKPSGMRSTDEPGGVPEHLKAMLQDPEACVRTVHRLDQVTGGLMVYARSVKAASELSRQIRDHGFEKRYLAVIPGRLSQPVGTMEDLLYRSNREKKTFVVRQPGKGVQTARLHYRVLETVAEKSLLEITLDTGRTHQIRAQLSGRGFPLLGDRKYGAVDSGSLGLWSWYLKFRHPETGENVEMAALPAPEGPWEGFQALSQQYSKEEMLDVVDENGVPTGDSVVRSAAHALGIRHRTSHVWLLRRKGDRVQILLQKRAHDKDSFPDCYDISSAGHIPAGVDFLPSAVRELREELGVAAREEELILCGQRRFTYRGTFHGMPFYDRQVSNVYALWLDRREEDFVLQPEEVAAVKWFDFEACVNLVKYRSEPSCIYPEELELLRPEVMRGISSSK